MSTISLNKKAALQNGISIDEALLLISISNNVNLEEAHKELIKKGFITAVRDENYQSIGWRLTKKGIDIIDSVVLDSEKSEEKEDLLLELSKKLKEIFPKGKKPGTNYYWADGTALISRRLKLFFRKYGNTYSEEQIVQATKKYVQGFNGNYQYMRLLKYFIFKEKTNANGEIEGDSELISYIENEGQEDVLTDVWTSQLN